MKSTENDRTPKKRKTFLRFRWIQVTFAWFVFLSGCSGTPRPVVTQERTNQTRALKEMNFQNARKAVEKSLAQLVPECMKKLGFKYVASTSKSPFEGLGTLNFAKTLGFGVSTFLQSPELLRKEDPNMSYLLSIDAKQRDRFSQSINKCGTDSVETLSKNPSLRTSFELIRSEEAFASEGVTTKEWRVCMIKNGYRVTALEGLTSKFERDVRALLGHDGPVRWIGGRITVQLPDNPEPISADKLPRLGLIQQAEIAAATSSARCTYG